MRDSWRTYLHMVRISARCATVLWLPPAWLSFRLSLEKGFTRWALRLPADTSHHTWLESEYLFLHESLRHQKCSLLSLWIRLSSWLLWYILKFFFFNRSISLSIMILDGTSGSMARIPRYINGALLKWMYLFLIFKSHETNIPNFTFLFYLYMPQYW